MRMSLNHALFDAQVQALKKKLNNAKIKGAMEAARKTQIYAQANAPFRTGDLARGFRVRPLGSAKSLSGQGARLTNTVDGSFPYNKWVNRTQPHHNPPMRWNNFRPTLYRGVKKTSSGKPVKWTGKAEFLTLAVNKVRPKFKGYIITRFRRGE